MRRLSRQPQRTTGRSPIRKVYGADRLGIVGFNDTGFVIAKPVEAHAAWLQERTRKLSQRIKGTHTNMTDGLRIAINMLKQSPRGVHRRIWLLSDGRPNIETWSLMNVASTAFENFININSIGFGDPGASDYDEGLLRKISASTHRGAFIPVQSLRQLTDALVSADAGRRRRRYHVRAETTVLCIDLSGSMTFPMEGRRRVDIVEEAILHLLLYKQRCFS